MNELMMQTAEAKYDGDEDILPVAVMAMIRLSGESLTPVGIMTKEQFIVEGVDFDPQDEATVYACSIESETHKYMATACFGERWRLLIVEPEGEGFTPHLCVIAEALAGFFGDSEAELLAMLDLRKDTIEA